MASIRKRGDKWIAEICVNKKRKARSFKAKVDAQRWAIDMEIQYGAGKEVAEGKSLRDAFERYAEEVTVNKKSQRWESNRLKKIGGDDIADMMLQSINYIDINNWIGEQTTASGTINRDLNLLSSVFTHCIKWRWIDDNPVAKCDRPKPPKHRTRRVWPDEQTAIIEMLGYEEEKRAVTRPQQAAAAFILALETGMRQGEIFKLKTEDVDWDDRTALVRDTKNSDDRYVPLSSTAISVLKNLNVDSETFFTYTQEATIQSFRTTVKTLKIKNLRFHDTRHEAATRLAKVYKLEALCKVIGHNDPRSLMIYYNPTGAELAAMLD